MVDRDPKAPKVNCGIKRANISIPYYSPTIDIGVLKDNTKGRQLSINLNYNQLHNQMYIFYNLHYMLSKSCLKYGEQKYWFSYLIISFFTLHVDNRYTYVK